MTDWALDREVVLVRVLDAPRDEVFAAWTDPDALCEWFGPDGYTCVVHEMDARVGGRAREARPYLRRAGQRDSGRQPAITPAAFHPPGTVVG